MTERTLLLVDGSSFLYRAFHALPDLRSPEGAPTGAIYGMVAMLRRLRSDGKLNGGATHGAVVFDAPGKTFRDDWYPQYKANRSAMPEDLVRQIPVIHQVVQALGWPLLMVDNIEADDVIGTLAGQAGALGMRTVISTGDKDLAQLVDDRVVLINTMTAMGGPPERLDRAGVQAKFGVPPERIVDYLSLVGDSVDNVPGVEKVGPKTAAKWLGEYGTLDGVIEHAAQIKGVVGDNLRRALDWLPQARRLVTVKTDCDLSAQVHSIDESLDFRSEDFATLRDLFTRCGFKTWMRDLETRAAAAGTPLAAPGADGGGNGAGGAKSATTDLFGDVTDDQVVAAESGVEITDPGIEARTPGSGPMTASPVTEYETVLTEEALTRWIARIRSAELVALDTETTSLLPMQARLVGLSLSVEPFKACYIPLAHRYAGAPDQLSREHVLEALRPWLEDPACAKVGQHLKYDAHVLENYGIRLRGIEHDTLLQSYVLEAHRPHDMDSLALRHLNRKTVEYDAVTGKGAGRIDFDQVSVESATGYSAEDAEVTMQLHRTLYPRLAADSRLDRVYREIEMPTSIVLQRMERNGVLIDAALLSAQSDELGRNMMKLEARAHELAGGAFNLGSPKQLGELLFGRMKLPVVKKTASGAPSTDEDVLAKLAEDYPLPKVILEHRGLSKLKSTYTDKLPKMVNPDTGRVHTSYGQAVAVTGRLASNDPNLQNIPIRTAEGRRIREAFIAPPGSQLMSADYSQIELRIMAHISEDAGLMKAFAEGLDVHRATAAEIFGTTPEEVNPEQRRYAKVINFGLIYGMSAFGLAQNLGIERDAARTYIERYFARYPNVKRYMDETRIGAKERGYVETVFGRRLWLPEINSPNGPRRAGSERAAINAPMQGTAADLIKLAMMAVQSWLERERLATRLIMQVHDELVLEVPDGEIDIVRAQVAKLMTGVAELKVPLEVGVGTGLNWEKAH